MTKNRISFYPMIVAVAVTMTIMLSGCEINDPTKDLKVIVKTIQRENMISVTLNDVVNGNVITSDATVVISGQDAAKVTDEVNNKKTTFTVQNGFLTFAIVNGTTISAGTPVKLTLKITSSNYMAVDYPITITANGNQSFAVNMVKKAELAAAGIEQASFPAAATSNTSGQTTAPVVVQTSQGSQIMIPQGTTLKDASGAALTGSINVATTVYYPKAAELIPQGVQKTSTQVAYPLMSINVAVTDNTGKVANSVNGDVFIPADANLNNPVTGAAYLPGDKLKLGYVNSSGEIVYTGEMQYIAASSSSMGKTGKKMAGVACWWSSLQSLTGNISSPIQAYFTSSLSSATISLGPSFNAWDFAKAPIQLVVDNVSTGVLTGAYRDVYTFDKVTSTKTITFSNSAPCKAYFRIPGNDSIRLSASVTLLDGFLHSIEYRAPTNVRIYDIMVKGKCPSDKAKEIIPGGTVVNVYNETGAALLSTISLNTTAEARLYLQKFNKYKVRSTYNGKLYEADMTVDANGVPQISGADVQVINVDASKTPIVLQYYILTSEACD